ncbi:MAG: DUF6384 family protein [Halioglobus sp.]
MAQASAEQQPLDDLMLAMDVVDTLRHQQVLIERELNAEDRDRKLIERLREIYASQGIDVPDHVLEEGVAALKEDRFAYTPPPENFSTRLARLYISRGKWGKPLLLGLGAIALVLLAYVLLIRGPAERELAQLPSRLDKQHELLVREARGETARARTEALYSQGKSALASGEKDGAVAVLTQMEALRNEIEREYELRIVSRPGERSGIWRVPDANTNARNYYIIVEAVTPEGRVLKRTVVNEENGKSYEVDKWGLRVEEPVFERVAADKQDDGIIQQNRFGIKRRGYLTPEYLLPTTGGAITAW